MEATTTMERGVAFDDCLCLACGQGPLAGDGPDRVVCAGCGESYDVIGGVPCLLRYQPDEALSLIEILSNLDQKRTAPTASVYGSWFDMLDAALRGEDVDARLGPPDSQMRRFMPGRLRQYTLLREFLTGVEIAGADVLDVGAGEGFDAALLERLGARVTAAEFNPLFSALGRNATGARWIAASAHALPFRNESFDIVVAQAALHHILDVPAAMREALRVLRPGGLLLTISDSYRPDAAGEEFVLKRFDRDAAVLRGVNEGIPRFSDFTAALAPHGDALEVTIRTSRVFGIRDAETGARSDIASQRDWRWPQDAARLGETSGGVSFRVLKRRSLALTPPNLNAPAVRPADFIAGGRSKAEAMAALVRHMPRSCCDLPFPGQTGNTKFELLNGWMALREDEPYRRGYARARRFLTPPARACALLLEVSALRRPMTLQIMVNGRMVSEIAVAPSDWRVCDVALEGLERETPISVELIVAAPGGAAADGSDAAFDDSVFLVRRLELTRSASPAQVAGGHRDDIPVAIIAFRRPDTTRAVLEVVRHWRPRDLFLIADGPRDAGDVADCAETRRVFEASVDWECRVHREVSDVNLGLRRRVESGVDRLFERFDRAILLEDDCVPAPCFVDFCGALLDRYADDDRVALISGDNAHGHAPDAASYYFSRYSLIWGWASWRRAWTRYGDGADYWPDARDSHFLHAVFGSRLASAWWTTVLERNHAGGNSWATVWLLSNLLHGRLCAIPSVNLVSNVGFGADATHTKGSNPVRTATRTDALRFPLTHPDAPAPDDAADRMIDKIMFSRDRHVFRGGPSVLYDAIHADAMRRVLLDCGLSILAANHLIATFFRAARTGARARRDHAALSVADAFDRWAARRDESTAAERRLEPEILEHAALLRSPEALLRRLAS